MTVSDEMEAVEIHKRLIQDEYIVERDGGRWAITEPKNRDLPQRAYAIRSMREAAVWADAVEKIRFVLWEKTKC